MLRKLAQLYRCTRGVPWGQLVRRAELNLRRRASVSLLRGLYMPSSERVPALRTPLPRRCFLPRTHLVSQGDGGYFLDQHGLQVPLQSTVNWQLDGIPHTHLQRLTVHYHEFLESLPKEFCEPIVLDWIHHNPPLQPRYWLDSWNSYAISIRTVCWMQWMAESEAYGEHEILRSLVQQIRFLVKNLETDIRGNHLIKNIRCLFWASRFFEGAEAERWRSLADRLLSQELKRQFLPDGMHYELSPAYHCQVVGDLLECASVLEGHERTELVAKLGPMIDAMRLVTHPDGLISLFSDGGLHMVYSPAEIEEARQALGEGDRAKGIEYKEIEEMGVADSHASTGSLTSELPALCSAPSTMNQRPSTLAAPSPLRSLPSAPRSSLSALRSSGYYLWRSNRQWLLVDCGPVCEESLPAHGHADMLAFEWDVDGKRFVVDNGVYQYEAGVSRHYDRSVASHNTVQVGELDQAELIGSFRTGRRTAARCEHVRTDSELFELVGSHNGFRPAGQAWTHRRRFFAEAATLLIEDEVSGGDRASGKDSQSAIARFLFHDQCRFERMSDTELRVIRDASSVILSSDLPLQVVPAEWSPDFGERVATHRVEARFASVPGTASFQFTLES